MLVEFNLEENKLMSIWWIDANAFMLVESLAAF